MCDCIAHRRERDQEKQSVYQHCCGTAEKAESYGSGLNCGEIAKLAGYIHDMGKCCRDFNDYIMELNHMHRGEIDHCYAGARHIREVAAKMEGGTRDRQYKETADFVARVVMSHHGLCDWLDEDGEDYFERRVGKEERYREICGKYAAMISDEALMTMLEKASEEYAVIRRKISQLSDRNKVKRAFYMGMFERLILSMLVDADRNDTADFMAGKKLEQTFSTDIWPSFCERMEEKCAAFAKDKTRIAVLRSNISERCAAFAQHEVNICRLIVPTGGGKTVSSLRFALNYCREHGKERIFYIAPFMSILEQNSAVIREIVGEDYVLEHHSDVVADMEDEQELNAYELRTDRWDMPVIATTLVQFLNTFFLGKMTSVRRMHRLCNAVIIIDEIQSIPTKCVSMFNLAMNFMTYIGGSSIVLCSATQPTLEHTAYGLILDAQESMTGDYREDFNAFKRNQIIAAVRRSGYSCEEAAGFCMERFREEGSVLMVVNTKSSALNIYKALLAKAVEGVEILHLSTNMCPEHRRDIIAKLKDLLYNKRNVICITTQLIEAGVDISFPCVIRSLAGMDNAAQAAGRCNRSGEFERCCHVYLINLCEEKLGNLTEIQTAQNISRQMIESGRYEDLLAVSTMSDYFRKYYMERKGDLNYCVDESRDGISLMDWLSLDMARWSQKVHPASVSYKAQAFKSAGRYFEVIDQATTPVIVPYNEEACTLILELQGDLAMDEMTKKLRSVQKYVVGLYPNMVQTLKDAAFNSLPCGAIALREGFYDQKVGVVREGEPMGLMMIE